MSRTAPGRTHDLTILRHDGVLDRLSAGAGVMADKGYVGMAADAGIRPVVIPAKATKNHPRSDDQKATWANTDTTVVADNRVPNSGVPLRSENRVLHVEQRRTRVLFGPYRAGTVRFPWFRFPWSGQSRLGQQNRLRSSMTDTNG